MLPYNKKRCYAAMDTEEKLGETEPLYLTSIYISPT